MFPLLLVAASIFNRKEQQQQQQQQQLKEQRQQQQLAHTPHHGPDGHVRCGTTIPDVEEDDLMAQAAPSAGRASIREWTG
jgi:hypothetical protein